MEFRASVSSKIKDYCAQPGHSQAKLAEQVGVSSNTVTAWAKDETLKGSVEIGGKNLRTLAEVMGTSMDYLAGRTDIDPGDEVKELEVIHDIFHIDVVSQTLTITSALYKYLQKIGEIEKVRRENRLPDEPYRLWIAQAQSEYKKEASEHNEDADSVKFEIYPSGFLEDYKKQIRKQLVREDPRPGGYDIPH